MSCTMKPLNLCLHKKDPKSDQLMSGYDFGMVWPKGFYIHLFSSEFYMSKDGIHYIIKKCYDSGSIGLFFFARLLALLETICYYITFPFILLTYLLLFVFFFLATFVMLFTLPFKFDMFCNSIVGLQIATNRDAFRSFAFNIFKSFLSILYSIVYCVTSPLSIISPELTSMLLQHHKWGTHQFSYF